MRWQGDQARGAADPGQPPLWCRAGVVRGGSPEVGNWHQAALRLVDRIFRSWGSSCRTAYHHPFVLMTSCRTLPPAAFLPAQDFGPQSEFVLLAWGDLAAPDLA